MSNQKTYNRLLIRACRRIHIASMKRQALKSLEWGMLSGIAMAVLLMLPPLFRLVMGDNKLVYGIIVVGFTITLVCLILWLPALFRKPDLQEVAERLDLGAGRHNMIASGLYFSQSDPSDDFARAVVSSGLEHLEKLKDGKPSIDSLSFPCRRIGVWSLLIILCFIIHYTRLRSESEFLFNKPPQASLRPSTLLRPWEEYVQKKDQVITENNRKSSVFHSQKHSGPAESSRQDQNQAKAKTSAEASSAFVSPDSNQKSFQQAGGFSSPSSISPDEKKTNSKFKPKPKADEKTSARRQPSAQHPTESKSQNSSMNQGQQGGGEMPTTVNSWMQELQASTELPEDDSVYQEIEEQQEGNSHRSGIQPHLKDRNPAPSRDLGISGDQGQPGTGRGGPTPPKKSRGTASLVLGIPIPDFVRGRLGPGVNKVVREKVDPMSMPGGPAVAVTLVTTEGAESPLKKYEPPFSLRSVVRGYLIGLHTRSHNQGADDDGNNPESDKHVDAAS